MAKKISFLDDIKRMVKTLNKNEKNEFFQFLKNEKNDYTILSNKEYDKLKSSLSEAYNKGYEDGVNDNKQKIKNVDKVDEKEKENVNENVNLAYEFIKKVFTF